MYDIAIIGGGPAGSALTRFLSDRYKVCILDRRSFSGKDRKWAKACGGLLAPSAQKEMSIQGLGIPDGVLVDPQLFGVRTMDYQSGREQFYLRHYFNMDREALDSWLFSLIPENIDRITGAVVKSISRSENAGSEIRYTVNGTAKTIRAKLIVGAEGAQSLTRRSLGGKHQTMRSYISFQQWFEVKSPLPYHSVLFDKDITDFYSWTIQKKDMIVIGSALPLGSDARKRFELLKTRLQEKGFSWEKLRHSEGALINRPKKISDIQLGNSDAALIGEAAGLISPSSAEGLSYALKSGKCLGRALEPGMDHFQNRYRKLLKPTVAKLSRQWLKSLGMYNRLLRNMVFISGIDGYKAEELPYNGWNNGIQPPPL